MAKQKAHEFKIFVNYKPGDTVFFMHENRIESGKIDDVEVMIHKFGYDVKKYYIRLKNELIIQIEKLEAFPTKEDLIKTF